MDTRLPPELERKIFELAAHADPSTIQSFLCVARRIRIWCDFLHFCVVPLMML
jgi:hypothetical protein